VTTVDGRSVVSWSASDPLVVRVRDQVASGVAAWVEEYRARHGVAPSIEDEQMKVWELADDVYPVLAAERIGGGRPPLSREDEFAITEIVAAEMYGAGHRIDTYIADTSVEHLDIRFDGGFVRYADGQKVPTGPMAPSNEALNEALQRLARRNGLGERDFDPAHPFLNMQLADGSRVHAVFGGLRGVTPVTSVSIRKHRFMDATLAMLRGIGMFSALVEEFLRACVLARKSVVVVGAPFVGKTTLLRALGHEIPPGERIVTVEDQLLELGLHVDRDRHPDVVPLVSRPANAEGAGEVSVTKLVEQVVRHNPDRTIFGEVLGPETAAMLRLLATGADGGMASFHARSSDHAFERLADYGTTVDPPMPAGSVYRWTAAAIQFVVFVAATGRGARMHRHLASIREVNGLTDDGRVASSEIFTAGRDGQARPAAMVSDLHRDDLAAAGYDFASHTTGWVES
jgi:Flp pilus assembly CpaF family ATPase